MKEVAALPTRADLVRFVHLGLCRADSLDPAAAPLVETPLTRRGRPAGAVFHLAGRHRPSAVWAADDGKVVFYDAAGGRTRAVRLSESPDPLRK